MNWLLLATLLAITLGAYFLNSGVFLHPGVIASAVFSMSAFFLCLNPQWQIMISFKTYVFIVCGVFLFVVGCQVGGIINLPIKLLKNDCVDRISLFNMPRIAEKKKILWLVDLICIGVVLLYFRNQYQVSVSLGNRNGISGMISTLRSVVQTDTDAFQLGILLNTGLAFCRAAGNICLFLLIDSIATRKGKKRYFLIPIACLFSSVILSTGRGAFIGIVTAIVYDIYIVQKIRTGKEINRKMIKYAFVGFILFFVVFRLLGTLTGKSSVLSFWDTLSIYVGSSIGCLDNFLNGTWQLSTPFASSTFRGIYNIFHMLGFPAPAASNHAEMFRWQQYSSNVYTSFYPYLLDFGVPLTLVIQILLGLLCGLLWKKYVSRENSFFLVINYGHLWGGSLVYFSIAERLCSNMLALNVFVEVFFTLILIRLLCKKTDIKGN